MEQGTNRGGRYIGYRRLERHVVDHAWHVANTTHTACGVCHTSVVAHATPMLAAAPATSTTSAATASQPAVSCKSSSTTSGTGIETPAPIYTSTLTKTRARPRRGYERQRAMRLRNTVCTCLQSDAWRAKRRATSWSHPMDPRHVHATAVEAPAVAAPRTRTPFAGNAKRNTTRFSEVHVWRVFLRAALF